jgi:hypothetical protein
MANFRCQVFGLLGSTLPWSVHMNFTGSVTEAACETAWKAANEVFWATDATPFLSYCNADVSVTAYQSATMNATWHQTTLTRDLVSHSGTNVNDSLPWDSAVVVTFRSSFRQKTGRARWYLPAVAHSHLTSHVYDNAMTTQIASLMGTLRASMSAAGLTQITYNSRILVDGTPAFTTHTISGGDVPNKPASQDRRTSKIVPTRVSFS